MEGEQLNDVVLKTLIHDWHPHLRAIVRGSDPTATFALSIRTTDPVRPWQPSRITILGDAAHTMTPGRGAGANTALRDAQLLCDKLVAVRDGDTELVEAIGTYEETMRRYSAVAVRESLQGMNDNGLDLKPLRRAMVSAGMRTAMRTVDRVPALKRRMARNLQRTLDSQAEKS
ncbi:FAD-dependent oxidoreductase [Nocardia terpenica]|nr:FAD-dependent monooxygenase [Nocardia terpenica]